MRTDKDNGSEKKPRMIRMDKAHTQCCKVLCGAALGAAAILHGSPGHAEAASGLEGIIQSNYIESLALIPVLTLLGLLTIIVCIDDYIRPNLKRIMGCIIAAVFSLVIQNFLEYRVIVGEHWWLGRTLNSIYGYTVRPVILVLFLRLIAPEKRFIWAWVLAGVNGLVHCTALFSHLCFWIDQNNAYQGGPLAHFCLWVSGILLLSVFALTIRVFEPQKRKEAWVPMLSVALILGAVTLDYNVGVFPQPVTYLTIAVVISSVMFYIWLHLQFVREHEQALQAEQRIQIMMTQIQPHFLYNTIATIRALCRRDAKKAGEVAEKFGDYLRQNLDALGTVGLIPFRKELEHTQIYAEIEMVRFENIRVQYDVRDDLFSLPPLTVQPLVENAIRHGVRIREEGIVKVSAWRDENAHVIEVWDNGTGFDVKKIEEADNSHIGIRNVRERIEKMCGGSLKVESRMDEGTTVTITIPINEVRS